VAEHFHDLSYSEFAWTAVNPGDVRSYWLPKRARSDKTRDTFPQSLACRSVLTRLLKRSK
jgi:hypothetical protein